MISMIDGLPAAGRPALPFAGSPGLNFSEDFKCLNGVVHKTRPLLGGRNRWALFRKHG